MNMIGTGSLARACTLRHHKGHPPLHALRVVGNMIEAFIAGEMNVLWVNTSSILTNVQVSNYWVCSSYTVKK